MTKSQPKKSKKPRPSVAPGGRWEKLQFTFMKQFFEAGQDGARAALEKAPDCHESCSTNAMLSFYLGALIPVVESEAELKRLAVQVLPRIVESIAIVSGVRQPHAACVPPTNGALH